MDLRSDRSVRICMRQFTIHSTTVSLGNLIMRVTDVMVEKTPSLGVTPETRYLDDNVVAVSTAVVLHPI